MCFWRRRRVLGRFRRQKEHGVLAGSKIHAAACAKRCTSTRTHRLFVPAADTSWQVLSGHVMLRQSDYAVDRMLKQTKARVNRLSVASSVCPSIAEFKDSFNMATDSVLQGFDFRNLLVAGGSVLAGLLFSPKSQKPDRVQVPWNRNHAAMAAAQVAASAAHAAAPEVVPALGPVCVFSMAAYFQIYPFALDQ